MVVRNRTGVVVLALLGAVLLFLGYQRFEQHIEEEQRRKGTERLKAEFELDRELREKLPHEDRALQWVPKTYRQASVWRQTEKALYKRVLGNGRFDVLVVPFQVQDYGFARGLRSFMTAELAGAMASSRGGLAIPDPYLVARALGDGQRRFDLSEVFELANTLNVKRIVVGYVGHDDKNAMRLTLHDYDRAGKRRFRAEDARQPSKFGGVTASRSVRSRHFEKLAYSDVDPPIEVFHRLLPGVLDFLGLDMAGSASRRASRLESEALPPSTLAIASANPEPARDAYYFQLLAGLTPASADRVRERFIEKSLLALRGMSAESPDFRALKARALMYLGLRPAALHVLGTPESAEERHLSAMLNGNLPDVQAARTRIPGGVRAVIAALEENAMAAAYNVRTQKSSLGEVASLQVPGDAWQFLVARAMTDWDEWTQHANLSVKGLLDRDFPIEGFTARAMLQGASSVGQVAGLDAAAHLAVLDHVRRQTESAAGTWCCQPLVAHPSSLDYLDLLDAIGTDNLVRRARFLTDTQGDPARTVHFLAEIESAYKDHPHFTLARARAEVALAEVAQGAEQEGLFASAHRAALNVWYWEQGQTPAAAEALNGVIAITVGKYRDVSDNLYEKDYPFRSYYPYWHRRSIDAGRRNARVALKNSTYDFEPVLQLARSLEASAPEGVDQVLAEIANRFVGHPERIALMAEASVRRGDFHEAERQYRAAIRSWPGNDSAYQSLGMLLFNNGALDKAAQVFMSHPALSDPSQANRVDLSNYAYSAGSAYYWIGDFERAIPLYRIAAELNTGSNSSLASFTRLRLLDGDFASALSGSLQRARRYQSVHAYRDYFGLLHAMGRSEEAWNGFHAVLFIDEPQVWETALVGHRRSGTTPADIAAWAMRDPMRNAGDKFSYAAMYLLRAGVTDRIPNAQLASLITAIERPVLQLEDREKRLIRQSRSGLHHMVLGPKGTREVISLAGAFVQSLRKSRVKSDYVYMAEAYRALKLGDLESAHASLREAAERYDLRKPFLSYLLPYYAYAAARLNDTAAVETLLEGFAREHRGFDYHLAKAVIAALAGRKEDAQRHALLALYRRPFTEYRPIFPEYQFAELCEWLYEATRYERYREMALDWSRKNQAFQPWFAWPYAIEAKLSPKQAERRRAMAMAYYLDPGSLRLARLPRAELKAAIKKFGSLNPFLPQAEGEGGFKGPV